ncbi:helix-turn-helix domain-containing protein [uncultured Jatrophihabitans sp.]|uniref:helix-turn-helix transcriptional regulator n=1 Tax=uncultured Jatrophihabitans sp. TaxID=1610747 RepID=UPI0035C9EE64
MHAPAHEGDAAHGGPSRIAADLFFARGPREQSALGRIVQFTDALLTGCSADLVLHHEQGAALVASGQPLSPRLDAQRAEAIGDLAAVAAGGESVGWTLFARAIATDAGVRVLHVLPVAPQAATLVIYARAAITADAHPALHLDLVRNYAYTALWGLSLSVRWRALQTTLIDNRRVSIAAGILMHSLTIADTVAFDMLARASEQRGVTVREVAEEVITTGQLSADVVPNAERVALPSAVRRACAFIEANAQQQISLTDIASAASVGARRLQTAFRQHLGMTPTEYLRRCRLAGAHDELLAADPRSGLTIAEVATRWGFVSQSHFTATYRRRYRTTPRVTLDT